MDEIKIYIVKYIKVVKNDFSGKQKILGFMIGFLLDAYPKDMYKIESIHYQQDNTRQYVLEITATIKTSRMDKVLPLLEKAMYKVEGYHYRKEDDYWMWDKIEVIEV